MEHPKIGDHAMSLLKRLFGSKPAEETAEEYNGFRIIAEPMKEGSKYRLAARIEQNVDGEIVTQQVIRADTFDSLEEAQTISIAKAKQVIDEQSRLRPRQ